MNRAFTDMGNAEVGALDGTLTQGGITGRCGGGQGADRLGEVRSGAS